MKRVVVALLILTVLVLLLLSCLGPAAGNPNRQATPTPPLEPAEDVRQEVEQAIQEAVAAQSQDVLPFLLYEQRVVDFRISADGAWAVAWIVSVDPETGEGLPSEPGLVILQRSGDDWVATLPADPDWAGALAAAPQDLLSTAERAGWLEQFERQLIQTPTAPLTGFLLPWAAGETRYLSQSVGHDQYTPSGSAHYAFDFYISGKMWNIYAAKAGTVWRVKYDVPTCTQYSCAGSQPLGNYLVVKDTTTTPTTYHLYLHLAYDSIPPILRTVGATVVQGQLLGVADNTGQSYGHHLHFQVHQNPDSYWGTSVDIVFADVDINGGRPRVHPYDDKYCYPSRGDVCNNFRVNYVSANQPKGDIVLPTGEITSLATGQAIRSPVLSLAGWASDVGSGFYSAQFKAFYNGTWRDIGSVFNSPNFSYNWDMCADAVPDGPVSVALRVMDRAGNQNYLAGLRHVVKEYACAPAPPPACTPGADQAALYTARNFRGACRVYGLGDYPNLDALGDNTVASLQVGANVKATLYMRAGFDRRAETFAASDPNLDDNRLAAFTASSLKVMARSAAPATPLLTFPAEGQSFTRFDSLDLAWLDAGGGLKFQARYTRTTPPGETVTSEELGQTTWNLGTLAPGSYTWSVRAYGGSAWGEWSAGRSFVVTEDAPTLPAAASAPFTDDVEKGANGWTAQPAGSWRLEDAPQPVEAHSGAHYWWFGATNSSGGEQYPTSGPGDLTSRPIHIPAGGPYFLRFWYRYQTETSRVHWDQRWVQISVENGPFTNLWQLADDPQDTWLRSPAIDLSAYAGKQVRVRFHFHALDAYYNDYEGWYIDDVSITADPPPPCARSLEPNDAPAAAVPIAYGQEVTAEICPAGDVDYYRFTGRAGDRVAVNVDAVDAGLSDLDAVVHLLDSDGVNALAENDDEDYGVRRDPHLGFLLPHSGDFYLKVIAWEHPSVERNSTYRLRLVNDTTAPTMAIAAPSSGTFLSENPYTIRVQASDDDGISRVEFMAHPSEWMNTTWVILGSDENGSDGWSLAYDSAAQPEGQGLAFFARAYDWAGNWAGALAWDLGVDRTPPTTSMSPLQPIQDGTTFQVGWSASDSISGIDHYDLQWKVGGGSWQDLALDLPAEVTRLWVIGQAGRSYAFRLRAADRMGNLGSYPAEAQAATSVAGQVCAAPDVYEAPGNDNSPGASTPLQPGESQVHNFCNPAGSTGGLNDEDWLVISVQKGQRYRFLAYPQVGSAAATLSLYAQDGQTLLAQVAAPAFDQATSLGWTADREGLVFLRVRPIDGRVAGDRVAYRVVLRRGPEILMPILQR